MNECALNGRGQDHVSNFYIVDLENFATASRRYTGDVHSAFVALANLRYINALNNNNNNNNNSTVVGLFMTPTGQRKRLDLVTVECTCLLHIGPP